MSRDDTTAAIEAAALLRRMAEVEDEFEVSEAARPDDGDDEARALRLFRHKIKIARFAWSPYYPKRLVH
jgi:hypothetical protein